MKSPATIRVATKFLSVSPTGSRAALWGGNQLSVIDVASGVPILTRTIEKGPLLGVVFLDRQTVQLLRHQKHGANEKVFLVDTIDLETSETSAIITAPLPRSNWFHWFTENQRLTCGSTLLDLATGERIADLAPGIPRKESGRYSHKFLSDGRIIGYKPFGKSGSLFLYDRDGKSLRRFELGPAQYVSVGGQPSREELLVSMNTGGDRSHGSWTTYALNLKDGSSRNLGPMLPISRPEEQPGSRSTSLFTDASRNLVELEEDGSFRQWTRGRISHGFWPGLGLPEVF
ncbi:MAG: hypothetical protein IH936_11885 [Acidobacteria bacterium]|nr:hypothetical protein [Acidobacteriota bacterium]